MNLTRVSSLLALASVSACTLADTVNAPAPAAASSVNLAYQAPIAAALAIFAKPRIGIRVGGGQWNEFMIDGGVDVTFKVPLLPIPALRVDGEVWGKPSNFGKDRRGNAVSILGMQTFAVGYAGVGPSYFFTDDNGSHHSGFGAKALAGLTLPDQFYVEAGTILGASPIPVFVTIGKSF